MDQIKPIYEAFELHPHITTDSRAVTPGSFFVALRGEKFNGNDYAARALEAGAAVVVIDDPKAVPAVKNSIQKASASTTDSEKSPLYFLVKDSLQTLQKLATYHSQVLGVQILAITGSNGKTTTKELIGRTLGQKYRVGITQGNLNNHIGVPLTLLSFDEEIDLGVVEMGANHCGEIAQLCSIAEPNYGLITNIGRAHLEGFGGPEGVARGKGELLDYLQETGGTAFFLEDCPTLSEMVAQRPNLLTIPYSTKELRTFEEGEYLNFTWNGEKIHTHLVGDYNLNNMAAALTIAHYFGISPQECNAAIASYHPDNNRSQMQHTSHNTLILDAYNANPSSMRAALENFSKHSDSLPKTLILGDMRELGTYAPEEHQTIVDLLSTLHLTQGYLVGEMFSQTQIPPSTFTVFRDTAELIEHLKKHSIENHLILIKGSRGIQLEKVVDYL